MGFRIGIDISGGDYAPSEILKGAVAAQEELGQEIVLIGDKTEILREAGKKKVDAARFDVVDAPEKIQMDESAARSIRRKKNSSIVVGCGLLKERKIDAFVSCGNTGAVVSAATLTLGLIEGVERPGISVPIPTAKEVVVIIDVGANINPKPLHLLQYGVMASVYYSLVFGKENPSIGLLNIGEEETKGPDFIKNIHKLFSATSLNFVGNSEPKQLFMGKYNCVVCDGFVGNIMLKVSEGVAELTRKLMSDSIKKDFFGKLGYLLMKRSFASLKKSVDYAEYGGAPLLGVDGVIIIGHGRSSSHAVKNAIKVAAEEVKRDIIGTIRERIDEIRKDSRIGQVLAA